MDLIPPEILQDVLAALLGNAQFKKPRRIADLLLTLQRGQLTPQAQAGAVNELCSILLQIPDAIAAQAWMLTGTLPYSFGKALNGQAPDELYKYLRAQIHASSPDLRAVRFALALFQRKHGPCNREELAAMIACAYEVDTEQVVAAISELEASKRTRATACNEVAAKYLGEGFPSVVLLEAMRVTSSSALNRWSLEATAPSPVTMPAKTIDNLMPRETPPDMQEYVSVLHALFRSLPAEQQTAKAIGTKAGVSRSFAENILKRGALPEGAELPQIRQLAQQLCGQNTDLFMQHPELFVSP